MKNAILHDAHVAAYWAAYDEHCWEMDRPLERYEDVGFTPQTEREFWEHVYDHESAF